MAAKLLRAILREALSHPRSGAGGAPYACHGPSPDGSPARRPALEAARPVSVPAQHDGVEAMLSILAALQDGARASFGEVAADTGLDPERLVGHALNLKDDGCLILEREETLRLTSSGRAALAELGGTFGRAVAPGSGSAEGSP